MIRTTTPSPSDEEGSEPFPRCNLCDLQVSRRLLGGRHQRTKLCRDLAELKRKKEARAEAEESP